MDRAALTTLSQEELIALVLRLGEIVAMTARLLGTEAEQRATITRLEARIAELDAEVAELRRLGKTPDTSSIPPSQGFKANRAERRGAKRGPKRGHLGTSRRRQAPDVVVRCRPENCRGCGPPLPATGPRRVGRSQVIELPPVRPIMVEAWRYAARCRQCGERTVASAPPGVEPERTFGPRIEALLGYLHERHHLSYERLVEACRDLFGLRISEGAIAAALRRLAERARPEYEAIGARVRAGPVISSDETGARVRGKNQWHWVFQTPEASYHTIVPSRGGAVIDGFLDGATPEVWGSDLWAPQLGTAAGAHQICLAHQIRDLTYGVDVDALPERIWAIALRHLFGRAIRLHHERVAISAASFTRRWVRVEKATDRLVFGLPLTAKTEARRLQKRYQAHRASLYVFLERDDVEPTNNSSERDLRPAVIHRKVTGGYRADWGAEASAIIGSVLATARKCGENVFGALCALPGPSPLQAGGITT